MTDEQKPDVGEPDPEPEQTPDPAEANADADAEAADGEMDFGESPARPPAQLERLQKILAQAGVASRRAAEELIRQGRVQVNGQIVTELGTKADAARDHIRVDGKLLRGAERLRYFVLNKPKGYVTTVKDPEGRPTVMEFFAKTGERLYPVGRLDYMSEGLLLVTNDGPLANALTRAASGVEKTYLVKVAGQPGEEVLERLRTGVSIDRGKLGEGKVQTAPARIRQVRPGENPWFEVVLIEGRNRELRKMFEEIGHHVEKIRRVGYGPLVLDQEPGKFRELDPGEVEALRLTAAGKLKPKRIKATRMLPKEAGLSAELRTARAKGRGRKPFERKPERKPEGKFDRKDDRAPSPFRKPDAREFTGREEFKPRRDARPSFGKPAGNFAGADRRPAQAKPWRKDPEGGSAERPPRREAPSRPFAGKAGPAKFGRSAPAGKTGPGGRGKPSFGGKAGASSRPGAGPTGPPGARFGARPVSRPVSRPGSGPRPGSGSRPGSWSGPKSGSKPGSGPRPSGSRPGSPRPGSGPRPSGSRPGSPRPGGPRPGSGGAPRGGSRSGGPRPGGSRPGGPRPGGPRSGGSRPGGPRRPNSR
ncbi:MAG TPA: pseudouridine synthase [Terracidiphilus sp.]|nr:pseudouridine synthase [Terracidiphilus sp.]